jgi:hypothetical protein
MKLSDIFEVSTDFLLGHQSNHEKLSIGSSFLANQPSEMQSLLNEAGKSSPQSIKIATNLLKQLNEADDGIKKEPPVEEG